MGNTLSLPKYNQANSRKKKLLKQDRNNFLMIVLSIKLRVAILYCPVVYTKSMYSYSNFH